MISKSAKPTTGQQFRLEPQLRRLLPALTEDEFGQLERNILDDPSRVTLLVWSERGVLLDGHNRHAICKKHGLRYQVKKVSLPDLDAAKLWIINEHLGRRHFTNEQASYWRGKQYELTKKPEAGRPKGKLSHNATISTKATIASQHKVDPATIMRDAKYARAVDAITHVAGDEARRAILDRDANIGRQEVQKLAEIAEAQPQAAKNVLVEIQAAQKPEQAKFIIHQAFKQLPTAEPCEESPYTNESIKLKDGSEGFIVHNPDSKPVLIETNEMVDWASRTWNPVTGCRHGCDYCYAREIANSPRMAASYPNKFEPTFHPAKLNAPKNTPFPKVLERPADRNVFVGSMTDLFGKWVPDEWILRVFEQVREYNQWNYLFLTKFPQRLRSVCDELLDGFPDNAWVGCTVDSQARVTTAEKAFRDLRAKVRWLSVEPMQERLVFNDMSMFDWLVVGGKTASYFNGTPEFQPEWEWVEQLWEQARSFGLKVYFKENLTVQPKEVPWASDNGASGPQVVSAEPEMSVSIAQAEERL